MCVGLCRFGEAWGLPYYSRTGGAEGGGREDPEQSEGGGGDP